MKTRVYEYKIAADKFTFAVFALSLALFLLAAPAIAMDYYVSPDGDDSNPGTFAQPFRTIQQAANLAMAGDDVYVMAGTYQENVVVSNSGTDYDHMISFYAYGDGEAIVDAVIGVGMLIDLGSDYVRVDGLTFINGHEFFPGNGAGIRPMGNYGIYTNNVLHDNKHGIMLSGWTEEVGQPVTNCQHNEVAYNVAYDNEASGIWLKHSDFAKVHHNVVYHNTTLWENKGAITYYSGEGNEIYNNTLYDNLQYGIHSFNGNTPLPSPNCKTYGNIVVASGPDDVLFLVDELIINDPTVAYHHNLWFSMIGEPLFGWGFDGSGSGGQILTFPEFVQTASQTNPMNGYGDIVADPLFVNVGLQEFELLWDSPAIDAGPNDPGMNDPDGTRPDLGAYYFDQMGSGEIMVSLSPMTPPVIIPAEGGTFSYNVTLENVSGVSQTFDAWVDVTLPVGGHFGPLITPRSLTLAPDQTFTRQLTQTVPAGAPAGEYALNIYAGESLQPIFYGSDRFDFTKSEAVEGGIVYQQWAADGDFGTLDGLPVPEQLPETPVLSSVYPNPFNPTTTVNFSLPEAMHVSLRVYDISGREVAALVDGFRNAGKYEITFDGAHLSSGVYIYRLQADDTMINGKMMLMK